MNKFSLEDDFISCFEAEEVNSNYLCRFGYFDQLTVNDYSPGQGIPPHVDTHSPFQEMLVSLSLNSGTTMHFKSADEKVLDLYLQPRSLMLMTGEVRYNYLHSIATRKLDKVNGLLKFRHRRVSLTYRRLKEDPCKCKWPFLCDSQNKQVACSENSLGGGPEAEALVDLQKNKEATMATEMEKKHVYEVYDKIAPHFSNTRYKPWPKVCDFLNSLDDASIVADVGCGNGKYLGINKQLQMVGTDRSFNLLGCARDTSSNYSLFGADSLNLPLRSASCDAVISIAVVHHFSTDSLRIQALSELSRILRVGGKLLVYVWAFEQEHKRFQTQDVFVPWHLHDVYEKDKVEEEEKKEEKPEFIETAIKDKDK